MFEDADNFADIFRGGLPYYLLITLPILIICSSNPSLASSEFSFTVHRMSQYDVHGVPYGCRASALNLEAKSLYTWNTSRHCVVARFQDITIDQFREIRSKAGGLVILLPEDFSILSQHEKDHLISLEEAMMEQVSPIPIYFSRYDRELEKIIIDVTRNTELNNTLSGNQQRESALSELISSVSANGYQIVVSGAGHSPNKQTKIPIIQGELAPMKNIKSTAGTSGSSSSSAGGNNMEDVNNKLPLIILVAHLDSFGLYNEYLLNSDVAVVLSLADIFSKLHNIPNAMPKYRLMFIISESGALMNFQGVKKWLDENTQTQNVDFVLCLDTISQPIVTKADSLYMHVSKPPKEGTPMNNFYKHLKYTANKYYNITVEGVHKKINLADVLLAWEHERFSMKRYPAFTLSSLKTHKDPLRTTVLKDKERDLLKNTQIYAKILGESLASYIFNIEDGEIFSETMDISENFIKPWMQVKSALHNNDLKNSFEKYLKNIKIMYEKPDSRDPDFMLYDNNEADLFVYRVKPAVFDLFLTVLISAYLATVYLIIQYFPNIYTICCKVSKIQSTSSSGSTLQKAKSY